MDEIGSKRMKLDENGQSWMKMDKVRRKWTKLDKKGRKFHVVGHLLYGYYEYKIYIYGIDKCKEAILMVK